MLAASAGLALWAAGRAGIVVGIVEDCSGRLLWARAAPPDERVELRYLHTVERTPVVEVFRARADGLWLVEARFASQGAGLPTEGYVREADHYVLRTDRRVGDLAVRVAALARPHLAVRGETVDLVALAGDGAAVTVTSRRAGLGRRHSGSAR